MVKIASAAFWKAAEARMEHLLHPRYLSPLPACASAVENCASIGRAVL